MSNTIQKQDAAFIEAQAKAAWARNENDCQKTFVSETVYTNAMKREGLQIAQDTTAKAQKPLATFAQLVAGFRASWEANDDNCQATFFSESVYVGYRKQQQLHQDNLLEVARA